MSRPYMSNIMAEFTCTDAPVESEDRLMLRHLEADEAYGETPKVAFVCCEGGKSSWVHLDAPKVEGVIAELQRWLDANRG